MNHPRLFVGGPMHGQRKPIHASNLLLHSPEGLVEYRASTLTRQKKYFAEDETLDLVVYQRCVVMLDDEWYRRAMNHETMREASRSVVAMLIDEDWDPALEITETAAQHTARMKKIEELNKEMEEEEAE